MVKDSPYRQAFSRKDQRLHLGFNYKDVILQRTLSNQMFGVSVEMDTFLKGINDTMYQLIEDVKQIKVFRNAALDKYENQIN